MSVATKLKMNIPAVRRMNSSRGMLENASCDSSSVARIGRDRANITTFCFICSRVSGGRLLLIVVLIWVHADCNIVASLDLAVDMISFCDASVDMLFSLIAEYAGFGYEIHQK